MVVCLFAMVAWAIPANASEDEARVESTDSATSGATAGETAPIDSDEAVRVDAAATVDVVAQAVDNRDGDERLPTAWSTRVPIRSSDRTTRDLGAVLGRSPATSLRRTGGPGSPVGVSLRGSAADQVVVTLGGLPLTPPGGGIVDLSAISPSLLGGITSTRGTEGALHGAGALGGVIHLEPLDATDAGFGGLLRTDTLESAGGAVSWRGEDGPARFALAADLQASRGHFAYERQRTPNLPDAPWTEEWRRDNGLVLGSGLLAADVAATGGTLNVLAFGSRTRRAIGGRVGFPTPGASSLENRALIGGIFASDPAAGGTLRWEAGAWMAADGYAYDPGDPPVSGAGSAFDHRRQILGARSHVSGVVAGTLAMVALETSHETLKGSDVSASRPSLSLSLTDTVFLLGDRLVLHGAVRLDAFGDQSAGLSPRVGGRLDLPLGFAVRANVGQGVRMPSLFELHGETALVANNPQLRPESARTVDAGLEHTGARHRVRIAGWQSRYRDLIVYELYPPLRIRPFNVEGARVQGIETELGAHPATWLEISAAYTYTDARNLRPRPNEEGRALSYRPPHRGFIRGDASFGRVGIHLDVEAQSAMPRNRSNTRFIPGRILLGAGADVDLTHGFAAGVEVTNLLDDRRLEDLFGYPLPGRTAFLALRIVR